MTTVTNQPKSISIGTNVKLTRAMATGSPSLQTTTLMDDVVNVVFDSYSEGVVRLAAGVSQYPLVQDSELVMFTSDNPVDVIINPGTDQQIIRQTRRFSIDSVDGVTIQVSNTSDIVDARVSFLTTNKPPAPPPPM